jgi:O-antigen ligase
VRGPDPGTLLTVQLTIAAVLALAPLLILPAYFFYFDVTPKVAVVLIGASIGLLMFLRDSALAEARRLWADPVGRWFCVLGAAQLVSLLLSTVVSRNPWLSWNGGNWRRLGFVSQSAVIVVGFLIATSCSESRLRVWLRAATAAGTAVALYGILQYFGADPFLPSASYHIGEGVMTIVRPPSTLGHADYLAGYLLYVVFLGAALLATESGPLWKALGIAGTVAGSTAIVLSGTRGALLALVAGAVSLGVWKRPRFRGRHAIVAAGLCALGLAFYFSPAGLKLRARSHWALEDQLGGARLWLWRDSLRMASQRPLIGFGPETFGLEFPRYQSVELSRAYPDFYHESPHNIFVDALVSEGILGLAILTGFAALAWFASRRAVMQGQRTAPYLASALVAGLTAGLFVCFTLPGALYFYATVAILAGLAVPVAPKTVLGTHSRPGLALRTPVLAVTVMAVTMFLYFIVRLTASDLTLERAKRDLDTGHIEESVAAYIRSQRLHPTGSSDDLYYSRVLLAASQNASNPGRARMEFQQAFIIARRAAQTSEEQQNAWYNLAWFYAAQNDAGGMATCLRRSVDASPNWFKPHWTLAQTLLFVGRRTEAMVEARRAAELDGGKDPEIASFLQSLHQQAASPKAE